jgi:hypothetical protein
MLADTVDKKQSQLIDVRVGWSFPIDTDSLHFNFHFCVDGLDWKEMIDYYSLEELNSQLTVLPEYESSFEMPLFLVLDRDGIAKFQSLLLFNEYTPQTIKILDNHLKVLETWIAIILSNLGKFSEPSRIMSKTLFFRSSEKNVKFDLLLGLWLCNGEDSSSMATSAVMSQSKRFLTSTQKSSNRVLKSMAKLFAGSSSSATTGDGVRTVSNASEVNDMESSAFSVFGGSRYASLNKRNLETIAERKVGGSVSGSTAERDHSDLDLGENSTISKPSKRKSILGKMNSMFKGKNDELGAIDEEDEAGEGDESNKFRSNKVTKSKVKSALDVAKSAGILRIEVQRGEETLHGVVVYEIALRLSGRSYKSSTVHTATHRFSNFKKLWAKLVEINEQLLVKETEKHERSPYRDFVHLITAPFPALPMKCYIGLSLNDSELSQRLVH